MLPIPPVRTAIAALTSLLLSILLVPAPASSSTGQEWRFDVSLDGSPIGWQTFRLSRDGDLSRISIEASFDVKLLFFTAYSYRHRNEEVWDGDCLRSLTSTTDDNGELFEVRAKSAGDAVLVETKKARETLPACIRSFAYWNPSALEAGRLLNSQTGEYLDISLRERGDATILFRGQPTRARHVVLEGNKLHIELWYTQDNDWLALESTTAGGRKLSFSRQ